MMKSKFNPLGNLVWLTKGRVPQKIAVDSTAAAPYITPDYLRGVAEPTDFFTPDERTVLLRGGEVVVLCDGSNAGEIFRGRPGLLSSTMAIVQANRQKVDYGFLYAFLKFYETYLKAQTAGSGIPHLDKELLGLLLFPDKTVKEQQHVATIIGHLDTFITHKEALIAKHERIRAGLLHDLLTHGVDEQGRPRSEETHEFKDSPIGRVPIEWEQYLLEDIIESSAYGPRFPGSSYDTHGNVATMRTTDIDLRGNINLAQMPLARLNISMFKNHLLKVDDVLVTRSGTCGIVSVFNGFSMPVLPGAFLIRLRIKQDKTKAQFVKLFLSIGRGQKQLLDLAEGAVQKNIRGSALTQLPIILPSPSEQERILSISRMQDVRHQELEKQLAKLRHLKTGLMHDLLTPPEATAAPVPQAAETLSA